MSTSANFPSTLYATTSVTLDAVLLQDEWTQVAVEIEAVEKTLGANPQGSAATVVARLNAISSGGAVSFTGLTGTITGAQHGDLSTSGAAAHGFTGLTGTIAAAQHPSLTGTAAGHPFSSLTGTFTAVQHGELVATGAAHSFLGLSSSIYAATVVATPTGGNPKSKVTITIPAGIFAAKPNWGFISNGDDLAQSATSAGGIVGGYSLSDANNSATVAVFPIFRVDNINFASAAQRFNIILGN